MKFTELMLSQPPDSTKRFESKGNRLWIAYNFQGDRTDSIYCPYRIGNHVPDEVTNIQAVKIFSQWHWEVHLKGDVV